ncbi:PLP-dependent cysteine synthase family protein [Terriglobus aquaticus]|uniref:PLP-dependent cysteine synthase family protein n=1 Tax=Terriglobus aquaticus TaxID=940139 RepID=A0ABW9KL61_9BACT|nr:cysteine synthase family protein [Terriglobus aquaticus]
MAPPPFDVQQRLAPLRAMVGNTQLLVITYRFRGRMGKVCAKAEHLNLSGSIKDRMALHILETAYADGTLRPGDCIVEATSGNTGIAFAALGSALGHPVTIYMPDWMSKERHDLIRSYGATVQSVSKEQGGFLGSIDRCRQLSAERREVFLPRQFENSANVEAHARGTGPELLAQLHMAGLPLDAFVAGVGTGGTVMGVAQAMRAARMRVRCHPVEPAESPTLSTGHKVGSHRIQGISDEFIPDIVKLEELDPVIAVHDGDAILMAQALARQFGLALGISSGCNFLAAVKAGEESPHEVPVTATVFCDDSKKYLSTGLLREEPLKDGYLTPEIQLLDLRVISRCGPLP